MSILPAGRGKVTLTGSIYPDGEVVETAKIDVLGESPNATAKLYQWEPGGKMMPGRWREIDRLLNASISANYTIVILEGTSESMMSEVGLQAKDAMVKWEFIPMGCEECS